MLVLIRGIGESLVVDRRIEVTVSSLWRRSADVEVKSLGDRLSTLVKLPFREFVEIHPKVAMMLVDMKDDKARIGVHTDPDVTIERGELV